MNNLARDIAQAAEASFIDSQIEHSQHLSPSIIDNSKRRQNDILSHIKKELRTAKEFLFSVSFIRMSGLEMLIQTFKDVEGTEATGKIITTDYLNYTEPKALRKLLSYHFIEVRIVTEEAFHTKGYFFNDGEKNTVIIGSSNITGGALKSNKEWNIKASALEQGGLTEEFRAAFDELWETAIPLTESWLQEYEKRYIKEQEIRHTIERESRIITYTIEPNQMQKAAAASLNKLRQEGKKKALLIAATGTGKTYLSAFDVRSFNPKHMLFIVHREQILHDAANSFIDILGSSIKNDIGYITGSRKDFDKKYIFSTIQTISKEEIHKAFNPGYFDYMIIDEVHSYDTYTGNLIRRLVEELVQLGATVLILSATLRQKARNELLNLPSDHVLSSSYPCVTSFADSKCSERSCDSSFMRTVIIEHEDDDMKAFDKAVDDAYDGKFVLWIENTVDEAQKAYGRFLARCGNEIRMELLHSRFLGSDRAKKESLVTRLWGNEGWSERKAGNGFILVGTQILEQSLDIDADVLYTRLAPADMLFQRMGRLWRHDHADRKGQPVCHVLHPPLASVIDNPDILAPSSYVYLPYVLYRTLSVFASISAVSIPDDIRSLLEAVYDDSFIADEPETVKKMRRELIEHREKLESLSSRAIGFVGQIMSDIMMPRYSDMKTRRVMILSSVNLTEKSVTLLDGEKVSLAFTSDPGQRALVSLKLEDNMFTVPAFRCPQYASAFNDAMKEMFSPFIYIPEDRTVEGDNAGLCILIKDEGRKLFDLSGNKIEKACYSQKMGYTFIK